MATIRLRPLHPSAKTPEIQLSRGESKVVGRSEQADVIVDEPSLSRRHAQINVTPEGVVTVEDLGSTNHTYINDVQRKRGSLSSGDRVRFGSVEFELEKEVATVSEAADATVLLSTNRMGALRTLLVADDSATIRHFIELAFAAESISVTGVGNGDQAIDRIKSDLPDIVLADVDMPGKTGYEVVQYIRQTPRLAHIPVLLLSDAAEADRGRAEVAGSDGVLGKPLDPHLVISRVKELIGKPRREQAASPAPAAPPPPAIHVPGVLAAAFFPQSAPPVPAPEPVAPKASAVPVPLPVEPVRPPTTVWAVPKPIEERMAPAPVPVVETPKPPPAPPKPTLPPALADVFAAIVAATPHEPKIPAIPAPVAAKANGPAITDDLLNEVMRRVVDELSNRIVRETGPDIVSEIAERLVREEIDKIKSAR